MNVAFRLRALDATLSWRESQQTAVAGFSEDEMFSDRLLRFLFPTSLGSALLMAGAVALGFVPGSGLFFTVLFFVVLLSCATSFLLFHREGGGGFGFRADSQEPSETILSSKRGVFWSQKPVGRWPLP